MADYPDYFELIQIVGADIMVPIDVQGAYIMMPVDIQAQYLTLEIDVAAQSVGNIAIDLVAQTIGNLAVNISAQDLAQLTIDIDAQSVGIYLQPEWAALQGLDKNFVGVKADAGFNDWARATYVVPAGKTLYLCGASFSISPTLAANADKMHIGRLYVQYSAPVVQVCCSGGNGGGGVVFPKPGVIPTGKTLYMEAICYADHECYLWITCWGYEL